MFRFINIVLPSVVCLFFRVIRFSFIFYHCETGSKLYITSGYWKNCLDFQEKYPKLVLIQISFWILIPSVKGIFILNGGLRLLLSSINLLIIFATSVLSTKDYKTENWQPEFSRAQSSASKISFSVWTTVQNLKYSSCSKVDMEKQQILTF